MREFKHLTERQVVFIKFLASDLAKRFGDKANDIVSRIAMGISYYVDQYNYQKKKLKKEKHGYKIAEAFQKVTDEMIDAEKKKGDVNYKAIKCKSKGCNFCCKMALCCTHEEAQLLVKVAREKHIEIDEEKLIRQTKYNNKNWYELPPEDIGCVFLGESGECRVYKHRPVACRNHFSIEEPEYCDITTHNNRQIGMWSPLDAQIISNAVTVAGRADYMPVKLLEVMGKLPKEPMQSIAIDNLKQGE